MVEIASFRTWVYVTSCHKCKSIENAVSISISHYALKSIQEWIWCLFCVAHFWLLCLLWHNLVLMEADARDSIWACVWVCAHKACCSDIKWPWLNFINIIHTWDFQVFSFGCINESTYAPLSRRLPLCVSDRKRDTVIWKQNPKRKISWS